jgi:hypothetical protein
VGNPPVLIRVVLESGVDSEPLAPIGFNVSLAADFAEQFGETFPAVPAN